MNEMDERNEVVLTHEGVEFAADAPTNSTTVTFRIL